MESANTANQRIEYWWEFLSKECMEFWISLFTDLRDSGFFDGGFLEKVCSSSVAWDSSRMSWMTLHIFGMHSGQLSGQLSVMYALPELYYTRDFFTSADSESVQLCKNECTFRRPITCDRVSVEYSKRPISRCELLHAFRNVIRALL